MRVLALLFLILPFQDEKPVDPMDVDKALDRAGRWLKGAGGSAVGEWTYDGKTMTYTELVLYTLLHSGIPEDDPAVQNLLKFMLKAPMKRTYCVSLQAMVLQKLDPEKYQKRIANCAQFLVDNQCKNGQWSYGKEVKKLYEVDVREDVATGGEGTGEKPKDKRKTVALERITVKKRGKGPEKGDNSNSQYAALGLRACHDAKVKIPSATLKAAIKWWQSSQNDDGGWCYLDKGDQNSYGSMTAGAVSSLAALKFCSGSNPRSGGSLVKGRKWIAENFRVDGNPKHAYLVQHYYYYMYALERTGMFLEVKKIGDNDWYDKGAKQLLKTQKKAGSWGEGMVDTCFAILFLRRASRPLRTVATRKKK